PNPITGFDPLDDLPLHTLRVGAPVPAAEIDRRKQEAAKALAPDEPAGEGGQGAQARRRAKAEAERRARAAAWTADPILPYRGPYPLLNAALNLVHGDELAWQERKAMAFL